MSSSNSPGGSTRGLSSDYVSLKLSSDLLSRLHQKGRAESRSMTSIIEEALEAYLTSPAGEHQMNDLQQSIGTWAEHTFGQGKSDEDVMATYHHLKEEWDEFEAPFLECDGQIGIVRAEIIDGMADLAFLLFDMAHQLNLSLRDIIKTKLALNRLRRWEPPDERGVTHHIKE